MNDATPIMARRPLLSSIWRFVALVASAHPDRMTNAVHDTTGRHP